MNRVRRSRENAFLESRLSLVVEPISSKTEFSSLFTRDKNALADLTVYVVVVVDAHAGRVGSGPTTGDSRRIKHYLHRALPCEATEE